MSKTTITTDFLPQVEKTRVLDSVDTTMKLLRDETLPVYDATLRNNLFTLRHSFKSPWVQKRAKAYDTVMGRLVKGNLVEGTRGLLASSLKRLEWIRGQFELGSDILKDNITYKKVMLIQLYDAHCFFIDYARRLLLVIYSFESPAYLSGEEDSIPYSKAELLEIEEGFDTFLKVSSIFARSGDNATRVLEQIPEAKFEPNELAVAKSTLGLNKIDPMGLGFSPTTMNPIWYLGTMWEEMQHSKYEAAKEERKALELRLIQMRLEQQSKRDATNDRAIEYSESRLRNLNLKIAKMEKRYA